MTPVFSWLRNWRQDQLEGILVDIFITDAAGNPMRHVDQVKAIAGVGLDGDRYASGCKLCGPALSQNLPFRDGH